MDEARPAPPAGKCAQRIKASPLGRRLGKLPVVGGLSAGFGGNRMLHARSLEGEQLLVEGA